MFRPVVLQTLRRAHQHAPAATTNSSKNPIIAKSTQRLLVTSAQKRALNKDQISGSKHDATAPATSAAASVAKPTTSNAELPTSTIASTATSTTTGGGNGATPSPPTTGGGGSTMVPLVAITAVAVGAAYYMDLLPMGKTEEKVIQEETTKPVKSTKPTETPSTASTPPPSTLQKAPTVSDKLETVATNDVFESKQSKDKIKETTVIKKKQKEDDKPSKTSVTTVGNRVVNIYAPSSIGRKTEPVAPVEHDPNGNRVSVEKFNQVYGSSEAPISPSATVTTTTSASSSILQTQKELSSSDTTSSKIDDALMQAHVTMRAALDETFLKDLDKLSENELRIRIVQLASEMGERTKWEAVRLREFLSMKEKEVSDKFLELLQKQRLEFEDLMARRLRDQEFTLTKQANDALEAKEKSVEKMIEAITTAQQVEHDATLKSTEERLEKELRAMYESEFGQNLAEAKAGFIKELEEKLAAIEQLSERIEKNEQNLEISRNFESVSQRAHKVSAAALALAEKMETSKGAMVEFVALKSAATENGVIASALEKIPKSISVGIPTLPELQASFEYAHKITRQAAYVPPGQSGVEGQIAGMIFANLSVQPPPDAVPPSESDDIPAAKVADFILSRAKLHVKLGQLEEAVAELDKLKGQASFTVNDWKQSAMDRIAVDQALRVIKLECALMNKNMAG